MFIDHKYIYIYLYYLIYMYICIVCVYIYIYIYTWVFHGQNMNHGHPAHGITHGDQAFQELCQRDLYPISEEGCLWGLPMNQHEETRCVTIDIHG